MGPKYIGHRRFMAQHGNKSFTITHYWTIICNCPKFEEQYAAQKKNGESATLVEHEEGEKRPRDKTNSKMNEKRDAASFALQETLQCMMTRKGARNERKHLEKKEQMKAYIEIQKKKLEIEENIQKKKVEVEASIANTKANEVKLALMAKKVGIMMVNFFQGG